jgi:membrane associated rhomboid family serine protease
VDARPDDLGSLRGVWVLWVYAVASLAGGVLSLGHRSVFRVFTLASGGPVRLRSVTALVTHPFVPGGFGNWAVPVLYLLFASYLLRRELSDGKQVVLALAVSIAGGITYETLMPPGHILGGGNILAWGFSGAAAMLGLIRWRSLLWPWRVYVVCVGLIVLVRAVDLSSPQSALSVAALVGALLTAFWAWRREPGASETVLPTEVT